MTNGLSPKTLLALVFPALSTLAGLLISWALNGTIDHTALVAALSGLAASLLAALGAWLGAPGDVVKPPVGDPSDNLLMSSHEVRTKLTTS